MPGLSSRQPSTKPTFDNEYESSLNLSSNLSSAVPLGISSKGFNNRVSAENRPFNKLKSACTKSVCVIGAGAGGLTTAKQLKDEGHQVVVFEQGADVGGVWVYDERREEDVLGTNKQRARVHGSMYRSLRTNIPCELMGYQQFPFVPADYGDERRFVGHATVRKYLNAFADHFGVSSVVRLNTSVLRAEPVSDKPGSAWEVTTVTGDAAPETAIFDAVVMCNGHFSEPRLPSVAGSKNFPGHEMHAHNYRVPEEFRGKRVVVVGAGASGEDICRDVSSVADQVFIAARSWAWMEVSGDEAFSEPWGPKRNILRRNMVSELRSNGDVVFEGGLVAENIDAVIHCTGYDYTFPFLKVKDAQLNVRDNRVGPLYEHVFPTGMGPSLSIIGVPFKIVPFPLMEMQAGWVARVLSGRVSLPSSEAMQAQAQALADGMESQGIARRHTHCLGDDQWSYCDKIAEMAGMPERRYPAWRRAMFDASVQSKSVRPECYRDAWDDEDQRELAHRDFRAIRESPEFRAALDSSASTSPGDSPEYSPRDLLSREEDEIVADLPAIAAAAAPAAIAC